MSDGPQEARLWHALSAEETLAALTASSDGLSSIEAESRLRLFGPNSLAQAKRESALKRFVKQFDNVLIYVLLASAVGTAALGNALDTGVILGVVFINALIGYLQEGKAEAALASIAKMMSQTASVTRNGERIEIDAALVVPGDVVHLKAGDRVPADLRLLKAVNLEIEEAVLTGESLPAIKDTNAVPEQTPLAERDPLAFGGTLVTSGQGTGVAVATGQTTEMGRIGRMLSSVEVLATPLLKRIESFGRWLAGGIVALSIAVFLAAWLWRGFDIEESFMAAVGLAVAAIPEGLPAVLTIALAVGVRRMAARKALIRRLPAVETLGSVTVICSDKTGTLTQNKMTVAAVMPSKRGERALLEAAALCNDATLRREDGAWVSEGAPTERALALASAAGGIDVDRLRNDYPRLLEIPFNSKTKRMVTLHGDGRGSALLFLKGAPEAVLASCAEDERRIWEETAKAQAAQGRRVLALAVKEASADMDADALESATQAGMTFLGLAAIADPPRQEAIAAVAACRQAGIAVCMITGDHADTARAIGAEMGLDVSAPVLTGPAIDRLDDSELAEALKTTRIVARATPEHKLRLVNALQALGNVVAMTGDGVNDAPALKKANIGVAMGMGGTEAAKEASMMVLADDNFATIAEAVREGRGVYDNLKKSIAYILPTNMAQAFVILAAVIFGTHLPITPLQILWVNMVTAVTLGMALAFEPAEADVMRRLPRPPKEALITSFQLWRLILVTALGVAITFGLFLLALENGADMHEARTVAVNALVGCEIAYLFNMRSLDKPSWNLWSMVASRPMLISIGAMVLLQGAFTYLPFMQAFFDSHAISGASWTMIALSGLGLFLVVEMEKIVRGLRPFRRD